MISKRQFFLNLLVVAAMSTAMDCPEDPVTPTLSAVTLASNTIVGGAPVQGTVRISSAAPASGFTVALSSSNPGVASLAQASVTVPSGATSVPFTVNTVAVAANTPVVITGSGGGTMTANLTVTPPALTAVFSVTRANGTVTNECRLQSIQGVSSFDCTFNGSASIGPSLLYKWTYTVSPNVNEFPPSPQPPTSVATLNPVPVNCGLFQGRTGGGAATPLNMSVQLTITAPGGATATATNSNVTVIPAAGVCGF